MRAPPRRPTGSCRRAALAVLVTLTVVLGLGTTPTSAATITASYEQGYAGVVINGYGTGAMGTFRLDDGDRTLLALCIESDVAHSTEAEAYRTVEAEVHSAELDALLWWLDRQPSIDPDTAVAAAALAWYYAGASRSIGPPVWSDGAQGFAPITPLAPEPWDALAPFSLSHPVGLVVPGNHLDAAERRVAQLHRLASGLAGPWSLGIEVASGEGGVAVSLTSNTGPLAGHHVRIAIEPPGATAIEATVVTDEHGQATLALPDLPDGATLRAAADAPGPHREWDGDGDVQRLATPTSAPVVATATVAPQARHVEVVKRSTDATIGVGGAVFALHDANGGEVDRVTTDVSGVARFAPIDPIVHPAPYRLSELVAPPGLAADDRHVEIDVAIPDPGSPTVVEVVNEAASRPFAVQKVLSVAGAGPGDLSGFRFVVRRRSDGRAHDLVTGADGTSAMVDLPLGTYDVCETGVPGWAETLVDTGCRSIEIDPVSLSEPPLTVQYENLVPDPWIDTKASDDGDGDQRVWADAATIIDRVTLTRLVPGTRYTIVGELIAPDGSPLATGVAGRVDVTADAPTATIEVRFDLDDLDPGVLIVTERVYVGDRLVAEHTDLDDSDQTIIVDERPVPTTTPPTRAIDTTSSTTSTSSTSSTTSTVASTTTLPAPTAPATTVLQTVLQTVPQTLPRAGNGEAVATALRLGDAGFLLGVALMALAGLAPRRMGRRPPPR